MNNCRFLKKLRKVFDHICHFFHFQARNLTSNDLAAIKVIKLEPGKVIQKLLKILKITWLKGNNCMKSP